MLKVDIGCGDSKPDGFIGVDICPGSNVDIVADISKEFPFEDSSVDELRAHDVVEHLPDRINTMNEIWRVCKPGAKIDIFVPSTDGRGAFQDPTHISFWNINSFRYYCVHSPGYYDLCKKYGFKGAFKILSLEEQESADHVVHIRATLEAVKPTPELAQHQQPISDQQSLRSIPSFPAIKPVGSDVQRPFWSVMIPVYNPQLEYLEQTLSSILVQALAHKEMQIEVVDDCSTEENIEALVKEIGQGRISYHRQSQNLGLIANWNDCIKRATGQWVHLLHQDDIVLPGFYAQFRAFLERQAQAGAAFCRHFHIDSEGNQQYLSQLERETPGILEAWLERIAVVQRIQFAAIVVKRSTYETLGGFYPEARSAADWEMWKRIAAYSPVWYEPESLACYRLHSVSESSRLIQLGENIADTRESILISESYLPAAIAPQLTRQALEHYASSALFSAQRMLVNGNIEGAIAQVREGLKCSQSSSVKEQLVSVFLHESSESVDSALDELLESVRLYQENPLDQAVEDNLSQMRRTLAELILVLPAEEFEDAYLTELADAHRAILQSRIQYAPLSSEDQESVNELVLQLNEAWEHAETPQILLVVMLYQSADRLMLPTDLVSIPSWMMADYVWFILKTPPLFQEVGEVDRYYQYLKTWVDYLHFNITSDPQGETWANIAILFSQYSICIPVYFTSYNLKDFHQKRSEIISIALTLQGHELDYEFSQRSAQRKKIRVGILAAHFSPQTETFSTLPAYKHLNRDDFEIILLSVILCGHRLETYCAGHADQFVVLPELLQEQVKLIREMDLDIVLIATNVTARTNDIAKLSLHRLARIQIVNNSSCVTTGMAQVDYYVSGTLTEPDHAQGQYTETLLTLEGAAHCYDFATEENVRPTTAISREMLEIGLDEIVYISGANFYKITPEVELAWVSILSQVPNSRLVLYPFNPNWSSSYPKVAFEKRLQTTLSQHELTADRLILLDVAPTHADARERLKIADIYLDSYPFSGATSLLDPLIMGLPPVVMAGQSFRSRMGAALLQELHVPELIAESESQYIEMAIALAHQPELRQRRCEQITQAMHNNPRFLDSRYHSAQMATIFQKAFDEYESKELQQSFRLRSTNLIAFPDWTQPEEVLFQSLADLIRSIATHRDCHEMTLLIHTGDFEESEADMAISSVVMYLMTEEELEIDDVAIVLVNPNEAEWEILMPRLSNWVSFAGEDNASTLDVSALSNCDLADLQAGVFLG